MIEMIKNFITEFTGNPASDLEAWGIVGVVVICVLMLLFAGAWHRSEEKQWEEIAEWEKSLEDED